MSKNTNQTQIERLVVTGLITSTEYTAQIAHFFNPSLFLSTSAKRLGKWAFDYYKEYGKAPETSIEGVYYEKLKSEKIDKETAEDIEQILIDLNDEFTENPIDIPYLVEQTRIYFIERNLLVNAKQVEALVSNGNLDEAKKLALNFELNFDRELEWDADFSNDTIYDKIEEAFADASKPLFTLPKQVGEMMNDQLVPGGFIAFLSPEKRGKSWLLLELAIAAVKQGVPVAFFQAGDMTEKQQIRRVAIRLNKKSDKEKYTSAHFQPVRDCVHNQRDNCTRGCRECDHGIFETKTEAEVRWEITKKELVEAYEENPDYKPCWNCLEYRDNRWGAVWLEKVKGCDALTTNEAKSKWSDFFGKPNRNLRLASFSNGTLTDRVMRNKLKEWKKAGFVPKVIIIDYADLMENPMVEFRHKQNQIWKDLRKLSQDDGQPLVITVTQADADSYNKKSMGLKNFSEDKRKYAHVTAMYSMNQSPDGREKSIGIMRLGELLIREGEFDTNKEVFVLQNFRRGKAIISSFF